MKPKRGTAPEPYWDVTRTAVGTDYHHSPSVRAEQFWLYPLVMGRSRTPVGFEYGHDDEDRFLLHYIHRGELWHRVRNQIYQAGRGMVCLMDLREAVSYGNRGPGVADNWWVCFGGRIMPNLFLELGADQQPVFKGLDTRRLDALFGDLFALAKHRPVAYDARANGLLHSILGELFASRDSSASLAIDPLHPQRQQILLSPPVRNGLRYIARWYHTPLSLKKLHRVSGLSMYHFVRIFHNEMGMSPIQYLNRYRIEKARDLLLDQDRPIGHIGRLVGLSDLSRFARIFRRVTGLTPSQYRSRKKSAGSRSERNGNR